MSRKVRETTRHIREAGVARDSELGEVIRWSRSDKKALEARYSLNSKDPDVASRGLDAFKRSSDFKKVSTYKRKYW